MSDVKMPKAEVLLSKKKAPKDEFYTLYETIEEEVCSYPLSVWAGKSVFCPCDDEWSNFYVFFKDNFERLGLKSLVCCGLGGKWCRINSPKQVPEQWKEMDTDPLLPRGDFRSFQSRKLMQECDIVVTNPPFSLMRNFLQQIVSYDKQYLIISYQAQLNSRPIFAEILRGNLSVGNTGMGTMPFRMGKEYELLNGWKEDNHNFATVSCLWFTNLPVRDKKLPDNNVEDLEEYLKQFKRFVKHPEVINFDRVKDIPTNYYGVMGVPLTYLKWHNPKIYKIHGNNGYRGAYTQGLLVEGKEKFNFGRVFIQKIA